MYLFRKFSDSVRGVLIHFIFWLFVLFCKDPVIAQRKTAVRFFPADHSQISYMGRIDFKNPKLPRFWQPGVTVSIRFTGGSCRFLVNDEVLWGKNHNYYELVVDGKAYRLQTKSARDTIDITAYLEAKNKIHEASIVKNTEANIGYMEFAGVLCNGTLLAPIKPSGRKIEFIGNSITCGASADMSAIPCGKGVWQDQHNAYLSYGAVTARELNAQYHLSSVSGIGLMHSCCNMDIIMPQVYDKISMRDNKIPWKFNQFQPDIVSICLGQNDGIQDSASFCKNYISFIKTVRGYYPAAQFILLSSPMADEKLRNFQRNTIGSVLRQLHQEGDKKISSYTFEHQYTSGCDWHPDVAEHAQIAKELVSAIKKIMKWE